MSLMESFNMNIKGVVIKDVGEKIGAIFGEKGQQIGKAVDELTKNVTIDIGNNEED